MEFNNEVLNYDVDQHYKKGCINTLSGKYIDLINPNVDDIDIIDIISGLSKKPHYSGQTNDFFSISQHSIYVSRLIECDSPRDYKLQLAGLLHDASEAYLGDMVSPIKSYLPTFKVIEDRLQECIFEKYNLDVELMKKIKPYDKYVLKLEYMAFYLNRPELIKEYWSPAVAEFYFQKRFNTLIHKINTKNAGKKL